MDNKIAPSAVHCRGCLDNLPVKVEKGFHFVTENYCQSKTPGINPNGHCHHKRYEEVK